MTEEFNFFWEVRERIELAHKIYRLLQTTGKRVELNGCILAVRWASLKPSKWRLFLTPNRRAKRSRGTRTTRTAQSIPSTHCDADTVSWPVGITVSELRNIYTNYLKTHYSQGHSSEIEAFRVKTGPLALPAPYHLLPNTPYFRKAVIIPPPVRGPTVIRHPPLAIAIVNRYVASMIADDRERFGGIMNFNEYCNINVENRAKLNECQQPPSSPAAAALYPNGNDNNGMISTGCITNQSPYQYLSNSDYYPNFNLHQSTNAYFASSLVKAPNEHCDRDVTQSQNDFGLNGFSVLPSVFATYQPPPNSPLSTVPVPKTDDEPTKLTNALLPPTSQSTLPQQDTNADLQPSEPSKKWRILKRVKTSPTLCTQGEQIFQSALPVSG
ncbi:unnamed protein product [Anisakis simplex]|uniref:HMG box domain-containing protein n=1 Tax=Anisakis simplex TaxID=6269 RepID=A0A0M3K101_ANISI|nr:unnamed protein product [Anisakis simplex]